MLNHLFSTTAQTPATAVRWSSGRYEVVMEDGVSVGTLSWDTRFWDHLLGVATFGWTDGQHDRRVRAAARDCRVTAEAFHENLTAWTIRGSEPAVRKLLTRLSAAKPILTQRGCIVV